MYDHFNFASLSSAVPELSARGVIQQVFPLHEQRILSQLMKSWVQAVCEKQPLGQQNKILDILTHTLLKCTEHNLYNHKTREIKYFWHSVNQLAHNNHNFFPFNLSFTDDICDYFGVKIAMYFAWLGFYTTSMLYPAVIGFVLWMLTESDQVRREAIAARSSWSHRMRTGLIVRSDRSLKRVCACVAADEPWHLLRGVCTVQRGVGHSVSGAVEEERGRAGVQVGDAGHAGWIPGGTAASVQGERS